MKGKTKRESTTMLTQRMLPQDANPAGNVHGGVTLKYIDIAGGTVAMRHCRTNAVTASIDRMDFLQPVYVGDLVTFKASLNYTGRTSMEVGVRVEAENMFTGEKRYCASAYLTFVALDKDGRPHEVPPLILETDEDHRRWREAEARRAIRKQERQRERESQRAAQTASLNEQGDDESC
ncbi:acyl-CoA hydrolase [Desulfobaculum xiamenense]|uniref:Acyl-CoA hydrolase n=1 Tax=Desulfobaculum xiamenense TaxID=995050 RepID=A0A846QN23_9BACT|nr:acyl-CoA thioesterase [Desulfobaculum xiamenense]NJB68587.1 acyl-CoA hydrolase [Desulfobaculum xiamenense]